jgi:signal transduction histidine kinase/ligand-binding sensor domain-containing protein
MIYLSKFQTPLKQLFLIVVAFFCFSGVRGQTYYFTHYQVENGLSNNTVICSLQDNRGFMWFGTKDGLNRFDGSTFKIYRVNTEDPSTIGSNVIVCLHKDDRGNLWIGTERGLYQYNPIDESFSHVLPGGENEIRDVKSDDQGNLWFLEKFTLVKYNIKSQQSYTFSNPGFEATSICIVHNQVWVSTSGGFIEKLNPVNNAFTGYDLFQHSRHTTGKFIQKIVDNGLNQLFVGTINQGIKVFDTFRGSYLDLLNYNEDKTEIFVRDIIRSDDSHYWIATESGIYIYNLISRQISHITKQYNNPYGLSDNAIYTFCKDKEGGIWAGTYFGGLNYYAKAYTYFEKFFPETGQNSLSGNVVRELCPDDYGNLWIGTEDGGLNRVELKSGKFYNYKPSGSAASISSLNIHALLATGNQLMVGTFERGLDILDIRTKKVIKHYTENNVRVLKSNFFISTCPAHDGRIIFGTARGVFHYNKEIQQFTPERGVPDNLFYKSVFEDHDQTLWAGSFNDGIYYYNAGTGLRGRYKYSSRDSTSLSDNSVNKIFEDSEKQIWIATENGLCLLNRATHRFKRFTMAQGLPSNIIYAMLEDDRKNLWVSTSNGLVCMNILKPRMVVYTKANGLLTNQFNYNSAYKDESGNMYFGCVKGLIRFNPNEFTGNSYVPPVYLTNFQINGKDIDIARGQSPLQKSISCTDTIFLNYNQSTFNIDFAALSYTSPQMTAYAYRMLGIDKDWAYLSSNRKVYFTKLATGAYTFEVKAANGNGVWNKDIRRLTVIIRPPFWLSKVAYLCYLLTAVIIIYYIIRRYRAKADILNRRKLELLENEKQKEIYHAKIAFFTHIAHEIRTPLTLIKGPMENMMEQAKETPLMQKNLKIMERNTNRLLDLTTQLLDFRKTEIKGFSLNFVKADINSLIKENLMAYEASAEQRDLAFELNLPPKIFWAYVDIEAFNKIVSNLLNNAFKYAERKIIVAMTMNKNQTFVITVKNDGHLIATEMKEKIFEPFFRIKGFEKFPGTGIGLSLARSLATLHNGTIELQLTGENLNVFILTLPVHQEIEFDLN